MTLFVYVSTYYVEPLKSLTTINMCSCLCGLEVAHALFTPNVWLTRKSKTEAVLQRRSMLKLGVICNFMKRYGKCFMS